MMRRLFSLLIVVLALAAPAWAQSPVVSAQLSSSTCPGAGCVTLSVQGLGAVAVQVVATPNFSGTLQFRTALNGVTYSSLLMTPSAGGTAVTSTPTAGVWHTFIGGFSQVQVGFSSYTSGLATVTIAAADSTDASTLLATANTWALPQTFDSITVSSCTGCATPITGADTQVLFFDGANSPAGSSLLTFAKTAGTLTLPGTGTEEATLLHVGVSGSAGGLFEVKSVNGGDNLSGALTINVSNTAGHFGMDMLDLTGSYVVGDGGSANYYGQTIAVTGTTSGTGVIPTLRGLQINAATAGTNNVTNLIGLEITAGGGVNNSALKVLSGDVTVGEQYAAVTALAGPALKIGVDDVNGVSGKLILGSNSDNAEQPQQRFYSSRGTNATPTASAAPDILGEIRPYGYDGSAFVQGASLSFLVSDTVSTGVVPTKLAVLASALVMQSTVTSAGLKWDDGNFTPNVAGDSTIRARQANLGTLTFQAYDGGDAVYRTFATLTSDSATPDFTIAPPAGGTVNIQGVYKSNDGTAGATTTCTLLSITAITVKNGLITGCS